MQTPLPVQGSVPASRTREPLAVAPKPAQAPPPKKAEKGEFARALDEKRRAESLADEALEAPPTPSNRPDDVSGGRQPQAADSAGGGPVETDRQSAQTNTSDAQQVQREVGAEGDSGQPSAAATTAPGGLLEQAGQGAADAQASAGAPAQQAAVNLQPGAGQTAAATGATAGESARSVAEADQQAQARPQGPAPTSTGTAQQVTSGQERAASGDNGEAGRDSMSQDHGSARRAAVGRAMQVQAAVQLENATGQSPDAVGVKPAIAATSVSTTAPTLSWQAADTAGPTEPRQDMFSTQVLRGLNAMVNQRGGILNMRLEPPELGQLRVQMTIARGVVTAQFSASTHQAQALLDQSMASLRTALESHGLTVDRLSVTTSAPSQHADLREGPTDEQAPGQEHADAGQGRSRGRRDDPADPFERRLIEQTGVEHHTFDLPVAAVRSDAA